jgi:hypothetical protein
MGRKILGETLLAAISFSLGKWVVGPDLRTELYGAAVGLLLAILLELVFYIYDQRIFLRLYMQCWFSRKEIRLTISYLYNIEVNGMYLLVKSNRFADTYQPVGGVYKYFNPEGKKQLQELGIITDNAIDNDDISEYDLRVKMRNRSKIKGFLEWFFSEQNRETDPWREFYEELVSPGILPSDIFPYMHYEKVGQHFENIHFDKYFKIDTFKYADIYKPKYVSQDQESAVRALCSIQHLEYIWVTEDEIVQQRSKCGKRIAEHAKKIFETKKLQ